MAKLTKGKTTPNKKTTKPVVEAVQANIDTEIDNQHVINENSNNNSQQSPQPICIVIPYKHSAALGLELMYALRGWDKHLPGAQVIIIGDKPDFVSDLVGHIPAIAELPDPQLDVTAKLLQAIASDIIPEAFILSNDDIYLINPITPEELVAPKAAGILGETKSKAKPKYAAKLQATRAALKAAGKAFFDYSTHLPLFYKKDILAQVISQFKAEETPLLISSLFYNFIAPNGYQPEIVKGNKDGDYVAYIYRQNPDLKILETVFAERKFVNHNNDGYQALLPFLQKQFPDKSRFEK